MRVVVEQPQWEVNYDVGYSGFTIRRKDFVAAGIRWFSHWDSLPDIPSPSHCLIITGPDSTIEAMADGVRAGSLDSYLNDPDVALLVRRPVHYSHDLGQRIADEAATHDGDGYGYSLIGALAVSNSVLGKGIDWLTRGWFGRTVCNIADSKKQEMCSELVGLSMQAQKDLFYLGCLSKPANTIKPVDLFKDRFIYEPVDYAVELVR